MSLQVYLANFFDVLESWTGPQFDFVFADLPYGTTRNKWDSVVDLARMWKLLRTVCKSNAAMCFTCQQPFTTTLINSNTSDFRYDWVWEKNRGSGFANANKMPMKSHESVVVFYATLPTFNPQKTHGHALSHVTQPNRLVSSNYGIVPSGEDHRTTDRFPVTVQRIGQVNVNRNKRYSTHPTEKPVALYEYFLCTYTNPGDLALDHTAGVLTMAMAAHNTGRSCVVIEREQGYVDNGLQRLRDVGAEYTVIGVDG